jgi:glycosyltransferase involved in cell wall biosynthesis
VTFVGFVSDEKLRELMATARAFVFAAEEDFGIIVVEAESEGAPVLAFGRGGARETVSASPELRTGMFFDSNEPKAIAECVRAFVANESSFSRADCRMQAEKFSAERFRNELMSFVNDHMRTFSGERRRNRDNGAADQAGFKRRWSDTQGSARSG